MLYLSFLVLRRPPSPPLFPYTTLFRSPNDPTAWLYAALLNRDEYRMNEAVRDLERSIDLNDNRQVYRSANLAVDRKSTRLNSSHLVISYAVFCLKKQKH